MSDRKFFEIIFIVPSVSKQLPEVRQLLVQARSRYPSEELVEIQIYNWIGGDSLGIMLRFDFLSFVPSRLKWFDSWIRKLRLEVIELERFGPPERDALIKKFIITSDVKFSGTYDLGHALNEIEGRHRRMRGVRREIRYPRRLRMQFKTANDVVREFTDNISYGGTFIRGKTDLPLRTKLEIELVLPGSKEPVRVIGEVVHVLTVEKANLINGDTVPGCGIQFVEFVGDGEARLKNYIEKVAEKGGTGS